MTGRTRIIARDGHRGFLAQHPPFHSSDPESLALIASLRPPDENRGKLLGEPRGSSLPRADRVSISSRLMRYHDQNGQDWADIIDFLTMYPDARRRLVRVLGELEADHRTG
jgi:hypothetical protein